MVSLPRCNHTFTNLNSHIAPFEKVYYLLNFQRDTMINLFTNISVILLLTYQLKIKAIKKIIKILKKEYTKYINAYYIFFLNNKSI